MLMILLKLYLLGIWTNYLITSTALSIKSYEYAKKTRTRVFLPGLILDCCTYRILKNPLFVVNILMSWFRMKYIMTETWSSLGKEE